MKKVEKKMLKTKIAAALSTALLGLGMMGQVQSAPVLSTNNVGDAALFPYYTAQGGWQTFIRLINTSNDAMAVKVRFREQANSRDVLDFIVLLSPHDMWSAWTDASAVPADAPENSSGIALAGIRTRDTSCIIPDANGADASQTFVNIGDVVNHSGNPDNKLKAAAFKNIAFTGIYADGGAGFFANDVARLSEGHLEIIGIANYPVGDPMRALVTHASDGVPTHCTTAIDAFVNLYNGTDLNTADGQDASNSLIANAYLVNRVSGQGAGYNPTMVEDFQLTSLAVEAANSQFVGAGRQPNMNSADWAGAPTVGPRVGTEAEQIWYNNTSANLNGVDAVSAMLSRRAVMNEWADRPQGNTNFSRSTAWIVNFPTKNFYVDLQDDLNVDQDVSPTLTDPTAGNDAYLFANEYNQIATQQSCDAIQLDMYNVEEGHKSVTSPVPFQALQLCQETNVITFGASNDLGTANPVNIPRNQYPPMPLFDRTFNNEKATSGWASLTFRTAPGTVGTNPKRLPVDGFMLSIYNDAVGAVKNYTTIHEHSYAQ